MNRSLGSKKKHFNLIDVLILIVCLAAVLFAVNYAINTVLTKTPVALECTLRIRDVADTDVEKLKSGTVLYMGDTAAALGKIHAKESIAQKNVVFDEQSARFMYTAVPDKSTVYVTVRLYGTTKDHRYYFDDILLCGHTDLELLLPFAYGKAEIIDIHPYTDTQASTTPTATGV